jgi:hypothetical protein
MPPLGSCRSASHHPSVGTSITSNRSRIASAAVHTHTKKKHLRSQPKKKKNRGGREERERERGREAGTLCGVTLGAGDAAKATVKVAARGEVGHGPGAIEFGERAEEGEG